MKHRHTHTASVGFATLALLALLAGTAMATIPATTAYHFSSHPMISGTVVTVNDHQMIVNTDQGEQVTLEVDSRTSAPRDLEPGMTMRAEFLALENCHFYAQRVMAIRDGTSLNRRQAYANTRDSRDVIERNASASGGSIRQAGTVPLVPGSRESRPQVIGPHSPGTTMIATPASADYLFSTRPSMAGRVVTINDHQLVVDTEQGQMVGLVMDSRTLVPREVAPGTGLRAEFRQMKDGRYYATRIRVVDSAVADREQAYAHTRDSDIALALNTLDCGCANTVTRTTATTAGVEPVVPVTQPEVVVAQAVPEPAVARPALLPQTASNQAALLLLGLLALGLAGVLTLVRSRWHY
jgi:LPXTG-motif cell wall-anchored protein